MPPFVCAKLCPEHDIWTKALQIEFIHPGTTDLELRFDFPEALEQKILKDIAHRNRSTVSFNYNFYRTDGELCTKVNCTVAIRPTGYKKKRREALHKQE